MPENLQQLAQYLTTQSNGQLIEETSEGLNRLSFAKLGQQALALKAPARPGQRVTLQAQQSLDFAFQLLACWANGCLPLVLGPEQSAASFRQQLGASAHWNGHTWQESEVASETENIRWPAIPITTCASDSPALVLFTSG